jgi:hypothetical protein
MFEMIGLFLWILITGVAAIGGYTLTKRFVQQRLRYVDAVQKRYVPQLSGALAAGAALPLVGLLPIVGVPTAILFGIGVGTGVAHGRKEFKQLPGI